MRQLALKITAMLTISCVVSAANAVDSIQWAPNLQQARNAAARQNKLLLIHFWTPSCGPCKVVDGEVFPLPNVARAINEHYVPLKVNADQSSDLKAFFGVEQWPTDIVCTVDGRTVHRMVTDQNPNRYIHKLLTLATQHTPSTRTNSMVAGARTPGLQTGSKWASGVQAPEITDSGVMARRPGVDPAMRPGVNGAELAPGYYAMQPALDPNARPSRFDSPNVSGYPDGNLTTNGYSNNNAAADSRTQPSMAQKSREITNRFASPATTSTPSRGIAAAHPGREISNPYVGHPKPSTQTIASATQNMHQSSLMPRQPLNGPTSSQPQGNASHQNNVSPVPGKPTLGLEGRCPVTLVSAGKWSKGDKRWGAIHRGKTYLFAGPEQQQTFLANPDEYSPVLAGMDVVRFSDYGRVVEGTRRFGVLYDDDGGGPNSRRIYLFDSVDSRNRFEESPDQFLRPIMQAMQQGNLSTMQR